MRFLIGDSPGRTTGLLDELVINDASALSSKHPNGDVY
jgi:hypothetical protein